MATKKTAAPRPESPGPNHHPYLYEDYRRTRDALCALLQQGVPFYALITGESGMGKTSLQRDLYLRAEPHRYQMLYLSSSMISAVGVVRALATHLHITPRRSYLENVRLVGQAIATLCGHLLLWLDEADQVNAQTLQELRMLAESDDKGVQLFSIILTGLPALRRNLDAPDLFPLKRRIHHRWTLAGLRRHELDDFIAFRFGATAADRVPLAVRDLVFERTQAAPAVIDSVLRAALGRSPTSTALIEEEVVRDLLDAISR